MENDQAHHPPKLLIIDDDSGVQLLLANYFNDKGFVVRQAKNGSDGLALFAEETPALVLLDLRMPGLDGLEVLAALTRQAPETPVIIVSGGGTMDDSIRALQLGAWDYVLKPIIDFNVLEHTVNRAMERARLLRENRQYRDHLEAEVRRRSAELELRSRELQKSNEQLKREIAERRLVEADLTEKVAELEKFYEMAVGRELKMRELKEKISQLKSGS